MASAGELSADKLITDTPHVRVEIHQIIFPGGSGTWNKEAAWDEYLLTITNRTAEMVSVDKIELIDHRGMAIEAGATPSLVSEKTKSLAEEYRQESLVGGALLAAPTVAVGLVVAGAATGAAAAGAVLLAPLAALAAPIYFMVQGKAHQEKEDLVREFERRSLQESSSPSVKLPPKRSMDGSAFFPVVPLPQKLVISYSMPKGSGKAELPLADVGKLRPVTKSDESSAKK